MPFSYAEVRPYEVVGSLDELRGPEHGVVSLPLELVWGGRVKFDLGDEFQHGLARLALEIIGNRGFVLGGGHAIEVHGMSARPSEDIDLFSPARGARPRSLTT